MFLVNNSKKCLYCAVCDGLH